jgi:hypothetical protein
MKRITRSQLVTLLTAFTGSSIGTVKTSKVEKTLKKDRLTKEPFNGIVEVEGQYNAGMGGSYENAVNNQRIREGLEADFKAEPLPFGEWVNYGVLFAHKGSFYVRQRIFLTDDNSVKAGSIRKSYRLNGTAVDRKALPDVLPKSGGGSSRQGTEKAVAVVCHKVGNIAGIAFGGESYEVVDG